MNNIFANIPGDSGAEIFQHIVSTDSVTIERIISRGHHSANGDWYDQEKNEWVMLVKGAAVLLFDDGSRLALQAGDFITIPAHKRHRVELTLADEETIWLAVHY